MALSYGEIKEWKAADAGTFADAMQDRITALGDLEEGLREGKAWKSWQDSAGADAAAASVTGIADHVTDLAAHAEVLRDIGADTERSLDALRPLIENVETYAGSRQFSIADDGTVTDLRAGEDMDDEEKLDRERIKRDIEQSVSDIIKEGRAIETDAASRLSGATLSGTRDGGASTVAGAVDHQDTIGTPPSPEAGPFAARAWWNSLEGPKATEDDQKNLTLEGQKKEAAERYSGQVRNLDGIPTAVRSQLNKAKLDDDIRSLRDEVQDADRAVQDAYNPVAPGPSAVNERRRADELHDRLYELEELKLATGTQGRYLISYDDSNPRLQAITSVGNPDIARHVSVTTPGLSTTVGGSSGTMTDETDELRSEAQKVAGSDNADDFASVAFIDYQAPQDPREHPDDLSTFTPERAFEGGRNVEQYISGVSATNSHEDLGLSLYGHSYGSTTASAGAQYLADDGVSPVDNFAVYGSPGMTEVDPPTWQEKSWRDAGVYPPNYEPDTDSLGINSNNLYYMENDKDFISGGVGGLSDRVPVGLGKSPDSWGMQQLSTAPGIVEYPEGEKAHKLDVDGLNDQLRRTNPTEDEVSPHSAFPKTDTTSQYNLAAIMAGHPEKTIKVSE